MSYRWTNTTFRQKKNNFRKGFRKKTKTIKFQGQKKQNHLKKRGKELIISSGDSLELLKQKMSFWWVVNERRLEKNKLNEKNNFSNLTYHSQSAKYNEKI